MSDPYNLISRLVFSRPEWMQHAACRGLDVQIFFPERGERIESALLVCKTCPVQQDCLEMALTNPEPEGIWGGESARGRRRIRRSRRRP